MARINLLPWREKRRTQRQREFGVMVIAGLVAAVLGVLYWHIFNQGQIDHQQARNRYLEAEIAKVDEQIKEISNLEKTRAKLIARMQVIQNLQVSRPQIVRLFDELVNTLPAGTHLTRVTQSNTSVSLAGRAQSNARVSAYMRNIEASHWLEAPALRVIEQTDRGGGDGATFQLDLRQTPAKGGSRK